MIPTKEEWADIKASLSRPYGSAYLRCDSYLIAARVGVSKMKLHIEVFVNGFVEGKNQWSGKESKVSEMNEIALRFWSWKKIPPNAKDVKVYELIHGKRECKKRGVYEAYIYTVPYFNSPSAFIAHLKKHNESIEVLDYYTYQTALEEKTKETSDATQ